MYTYMKMDIKSIEWDRSNREEGQEEGQEGQEGQEEDQNSKMIIIIMIIITLISISPLLDPDRPTTSPPCLSHTMGDTTVQYQQFQ